MVRWSTRPNAAMYLEGLNSNKEKQMFDDNDFEDNDYDNDYLDFAEPGGNSVLRAATKNNPRNLPCPTCHEENRLTPKDVQLGYQCNGCATQCERGF